MQVYLYYLCSRKAEEGHELQRVPDGEPRFCLADVCKSLGLQQKHVSERLSKGAVSNDPLSKEVISTYPLSTNGGIQQMNFVNEEGLYDAIFESRKKGGAV